MLVDLVHDRYRISMLDKQHEHADVTIVGCLPETLSGRWAKALVKDCFLHEDEVELRATHVVEPLVLFD